MKPVLRRFSGARIGSIGASYFVDDFDTCGKRGVYRLLLEPVEDSFLLFRFVWWLDCVLLNEGALVFCSLRSLLEVFLPVAEFVGFAVVGFHLNDCIEFFTAPCWPLASLDSYQSFQPERT